MLASPEAEELLTVRQAAALLQLDERTIRNHINGRRLPARRPLGGKGWLIRRADLFAALRPPVDLPLTDPLPADLGAGIIRRTHTPEGRARAIAVLRGLRERPPQEGADAWASLKTALDADRLSYRELFPERAESERGGAA